MRNRADIDWRRWAAMLCIVLTAVFALDVAEAVTPCGNADCTISCDVGGCDHRDDNDGKDCASHHCCHGVSAHAPHHGGVVRLDVSMRCAVNWRPVRFASSIPDALERPPRRTTIS